MTVEKGLVFRVLPKECEINYSDGLPKVTYLFPSTVDNMIYFVSNDEFQILNASDQSRFT